MLQDIVEWFKVSPPALTALATLLGGLMAAIVAVLTAWMSHRFTAARELAKAAAEERREERKVARDALDARRVVLRAHLERLVACAQQHTSNQLFTAQQALVRTAARKLKANHAPGPFRNEPVVTPLNEAAAIATLYFPELDEAISVIRTRTMALHAFTTEAIPRMIEEVPAADVGQMQVDALATAYRPLKTAEIDLLKAVRLIIERDLLPDVSCVPKT